MGRADASFFSPFGHIRKPQSFLWLFLLTPLVGVQTPRYACGVEKPATASGENELHCNKKTKPKAEMGRGGAPLLARDSGEPDLPVVYTRGYPPSKLRIGSRGAAPICRSITGADFGPMPSRGARGDFRRRGVFPPSPDGGAA